jgi:diacylglycerol kinase family enzyme
MPKVRTLRARSVRIGAHRPVRVHVDDRARKKTPIEIRIVPEALQVVADSI